MSKTIIGPDGLQKAITKALNEEKKITETAMRTAIDKTAREAIKQTRQNSPVKTGVYRKNWGSTVDVDKGGRAYGRTVYQKTKPGKPGLPHLLENGHGGPQAAPPHPHIIQDSETEKILTETLEKEMAKG